MEQRAWYTEDPTKKPRPNASAVAKRVPPLLILSKSLSVVVIIASLILIRISG
jgi:hypothetical protein